MLSVTTRFAPSPTGLMHLGNARTALFSALVGDRFLLRIEDTDAERSRSEYVDSILEDMRWMGLHWEGGPTSSAPSPEWFQSQRRNVYEHYYSLLTQQDQAYPCFCSSQELEIFRKVQLASGQPPRYSGRCAQLTPEEVAGKHHRGIASTLRFRVPKEKTVTFEDGVRGYQAFDTRDLGDFIIRRADGSAAFFFCNAIDDALMGVTCVLRGEDHLTNTPRQILLLEALGLPIPHYAHCSLILGEDGAPLSKRNGSRSIRQLREEGYFSIAVLNTLARLGHYYENETVMDLPTLKARFTLAHLGKSPARFDKVHLDHWQQVAVRHADDTILWNWIGEETRSYVPEEHRSEFIALVRSNCLFPHDADQWARILFTDDYSMDPSMLETVRLAGQGFFTTASEAVLTHKNDFDAFINLMKATTGVKGKHLFMPIRAALTGRHDGPELGAVYKMLNFSRLRHRFSLWA